MSLKAKNFSLMEGRLLDSAKATSSRDYRIKIKLTDYRKWSPGQFVMLRWGSHIIGRPFAIVDWKKLSKGSVLELWIRQLGAATCELFEEAAKGMKIWVTAPLGSIIEKDHLNTNKAILMISGGVGAASILPIRNYRKSHSKKNQDYWIHGERTFADWDSSIPINHLLLEDAGRNKIPKKIKFSKGRVTQALQELAQKEFSTVFVCGPTPMLEAVALEIKKVFTDKEPKIILGLEEKMACGIGLCFSCSVYCDDGMKRCCTEGPWFDYEQIQNHFLFRKGEIK